MSPRTVDNIGIDVSTRWAEDREKLDLSLIKDARSIPMQTQIDVTAPAYTSEFDQLFGLQRRHAIWADFFPPLGFYEQKKRLFSHHIIPSLGSEEKQEFQVQRLSAILPDKDEEESGKKKSFTYEWEEEREKEEKKKEKKILLFLLSRISTLDKDLVEINSRRDQYHKG